MKKKNILEVTVSEDMEDITVKHSKLLSKEAVTKMLLVITAGHYAKLHDASPYEAMCWLRDAASEYAENAARREE